MTERKERWTLIEVLDWTRGHFERAGLASPRLDAEILLAHVLGLPRVMLYARFDLPMKGPELAAMRSLVARRTQGTPVAYLTGTREFWSLSIETGPDALIPRPESELLVEVGRRRAPDAKTVVDVGTGTGAVALALAVELPAAKVWAIDCSTAAAALAARNVVRHGLQDRVTVIESDLLRELPPAARPVHLLVANLPYIPTDDIETLAMDVRLHEPRLALDGGPDGLDLIRLLVASAGEVLCPGGIIALEAGAGQGAAVAALLAAAGFEELAVAPDLAGHDRVTSARWPAR